MAVDEAILGAVAEGASPPTVRFYDWNPPCLSLGRGQSETEVNAPACERAGIVCVRRPTGGRAILHRDELTYSISLPLTDPRAAGDIVESYRRISEGLAEGLWSLGIAVERAQPQAATHAPSPACFDAPAGHEITSGGRKLLGSAQFRSRGALLQHGSLPLCGDIAGVVDFLALEDVAREDLRSRLHATAITLEEAAGRRIAFGEAMQALCEGVSRALNVDLSTGCLSPDEMSAAQSLCESKYTDLRRTRVRRSESAAAEMEASS